MKNLLILTILLSCFSLSAQADRVINSVLLNGDVTATVAPSAQVSVTIEVTTSGGGNNKHWKSTSYTIDGSNTCVNTGDKTHAGTHTNIFSLTAPAVGGRYSISFNAHRKKDCDNSSASTTFTVPNGIIVLDAQPDISVDDISVDAGDTALFTINLTSDYSDDITLNYSTSDGTATAGADYTSASGTVTVPRGSTSATVDILTLPAGEGNFSLILSNASAGNIADATAIGTIVKAGGLIAEYRFDETEYSDIPNEIIDSIGGFHGQAKSSQPIDSGKVCNALDLSSTGIDNYAILPKEVLTGKTDFSVSLWVNTAKTGVQSILSGASASSSTNELIMYFTGHTNFRPYLKGSQNGNITTDSIASSRWRHLAWTRAGNQSCLYIDKVLQGCVTQSTLPLVIESLIIGQEQDSVGGGFASNQALDGLLDELLIFDKAISLAEITTIYDNQDAGLGFDGSIRNCAISPFPAPVLDHRFDEFNWAEADSIIDSSGNAYHANAVNVAPTEGFICRAADLSASGINDYISLDSNALHNKSSFSISLWYKTSKTGQQSLVSGANSSQFNEVIFWFNNSTDFAPWIKGGRQSIASSDVSDNVWHHLVWTRSGSENLFYRDGVLQGGSTLTAGALNLENLILGQEQDAFGGNFDSSQAVEGLIDEMLVFDEKLSSTEINSIYSNQRSGLRYDGSPVICPEPPTVIVDYRFDESSWSGVAGEVIDESGNYHGRANGGAQTDSVMPAIAGNPGTCRYGSFDGVDDYIEIADNSALDLPTELTISLWVKPKSIPTSGLKTILSKDENYEFHINTSGEVFWWWGTNSFSSTGAGIVQNSWYHIAITYKTGQQVIYINGINKGSRNYVGNLPLNNDPLQIGQDQGFNGRYFKGNIDEVRIYDKSLSSEDVNAIYQETHPCISYIDHFEISHDGQGLTCEAENITIKACADASCSTLSNGNPDVQLSINGIFNKTVTISGGSTTTSFPFTNVDTATLSLDQNFKCKNGASTSCDVVFADAGFRFLYGAEESTMIGNQTSGDSFIDVVKLQAVKNVGGVCTGLFAGNVDVELSQENINPSGTTGLSFTVNGSSIAKHSNFTSTTLNFAANSIATIPTPIYHDAGQIRLQANYNVAGVNLVGSSNNFWVSPKKLIVTAKSAGSAIDGSTATSTTKHKAGQIFDFEVTAINSLGAITQNYTPNDIQLLLTRTGPTEGGVEGSFNYGNGTMLSDLAPTYQSATLTAFNSGTSSTASASYSEVGLLNLDLQDVNYGFLGNVIAGDAINIGRFYPDHFDVVITNNSFADTCISGASDFTYIGQPFSYLNAPELAITAKNAVGATTQNYTQLGYQKLAAADVSRTFPTTDTSKYGADNATKMTVLPTILAGSLTTPSSVPASIAGVISYTFNDSDSFTYNKDANSLVATFSMDYDIVIDSIQDSDGANAIVSLASNVPLSNTVSPTGVDFRFGRWDINNTFGSERTDLTFSMTTQYYNGTKFVSNTSDNCTPFDGDDNANSSLTLNGLANPLPSTNLTAISGSGVFSLGSAELEIAKPSDGSQGQIRLSYDNTPVWLKYDWHWNGVDAKAFDDNPKAIATFGLYRGNDRIIYQREVH